ncbi:hypothetical protein PENTCL1PPCAC_23763, partial [Pristionchus entomophagus]
ISRMSGVRALNEVALSRLRLVQEYVSLLVEMEERLAQTSIGAARARTMVGHSYASLAALNEEMKAVVRVEVSDDKSVSSSNEFVLVKEAEKEEEGVRKRKGGDEKGDDNKEEKEDEEEEEKSKKKSPAFRPYGIL